MLAGIAIVLLLVWSIGLAAHIGRGFIHLILAIAVVMLVIHFFTADRAGE
jgi:hypothetical protein